jgi:predicted enzyme related to lactoylglutathione lyase
MGTSSNPVVFWEIRGKDMDALKGFYGAIFDWKIEPPAPGFAPIESRDKDDDFGLNGGLTAGRGDGWVAVYVRVKDPEVTLDEVVKLGGKVILPVTDRPGQATIAIFSDPEGHVVGLVKA